MTGDPTWTDIGLLAVASAQLAVLLVAAAVAWSQVKEARRLREAQYRPFVVVDFEADNILFKIAVSNIGATPARNVRIEITPPLASSLPDAGFSELKILTDVITTLQPGRKIRTLFDSGISRDRESLPDVYEAHVTYSDTTGKRHYDELLTLDLGIYWNTAIERRSDFDRLEKTFDGIANTLKSWNASSPGGGILTLSPDEQKIRVDDHREARAARQKPVPPET